MEPQGQLSWGHLLSTCSAKDLCANSPLPAPTPPWALDASAGERASSDPQEYLMFFHQSVNRISPGIWGRVPRCSSQRLQAPCLTPRSLRGRREAGKGPPTSSRSPRLRGDLIARFPEFLIHFGLNSFCEAVVRDLTTFQKTN